MRRLIDLAVQNKGLLRRNAILVLRSLLFECNLRRGPEVRWHTLLPCALNRLRRCGMRIL